jgi:hypothetical protein
MSAVERETLDEIVKRIDGNIALVLEQTSKHNGRLTKTEAWQIKARTTFVVTYTIMGFVVTSVLMPLVYYYINTTNDIDNKVKAAVEAHDKNVGSEVQNVMNKYFEINK